MKKNNIINNICHTDFISTNYEKPKNHLTDIKTYFLLVNTSQNLPPPRKYLARQLLL